MKKSHTASETQGVGATYEELRKQLRSDELTCSICKNTAHDIHHKNNDHSNNDPDNITAICKPCHNKIHGISPQMDELGALIRTYWKIQKFKLGFDNQIRAYKAIEYPVKNFEVIAEQIEKDLKNIEKMVKKVAKDHEFYDEAMKVKGLGVILFAGLVSIIKDPTRFDNPSKLWKFMGLHTHEGAAVKRKRGEKLEFSLANRTFAWKIGDSFNKNRNRSKWGALLKSFHEYYTDRDGAELSKGHVLNRAKRRTVKIFLACFWDKWMRIRGVEPKPAYSDSVKYLWEDYLDS